MPASFHAGRVRHRATIITAICIMAAVGGAAITYWIQLSANRTEQLVAAHRDLALSTERIGTANAADRSAWCATHREHVMALTRVAAVQERCGPPQMTKGSARTVVDAEAAFYEKLVQQKCA